MHVSVRQYLYVCVLCDCVCLMGYLCFSFTWWLHCHKGVFLRVLGL